MSGGGGESLPLRPSLAVSADPFERGHPATPRPWRATVGRAQSRRWASGSYGAAPAGARRRHLVDASRIEAGVLAMADDVWAWCERTGSRGRTVTVKIKWADFQQSTRSRSLGGAVDSRASLHEASLALIRSVLPTSKGIRLVGVTLSNFSLGAAAEAPQPLSLDLAGA